MSKTPKCSVCNIGIMEVALHRNGPKGGDPDWRCWFHLDKNKKPDDEHMEFIGILEGALSGKKIN